MKTSLTRLILTLVVLLALLGIGSASSASASIDLPAPKAQDGGGGAISSRNAPQPQSTMGSRDWTREEMLNAIPYPLERSGSSAPAVLSADSAQTQGQPMLIEGSMPSGERAAVGAVPSLSMGGFGPLGYGYPAPFTRYENFDSYTVYPYKTVGKLFYTQYGVNYVCSAASIGGYAIWTAGHCVHAGDGTSGGWSYNVRFVPGYKNGSAPLGQWTYSHLWVKTAWYDSQDLRYDMGGAVLNKLSRKSISQKVGALGFAWNWPVEQAWFDIGYPAEAPFTGGRQQICASSYAYSDTSWGTPYPSGIGCDQTGGSSGGPWIWQFGTGNYLNGHNSYRYVGNDYEMYSPYFDDSAYSLWYTLVTDVP